MDQEFINKYFRGEYSDEGLDQILDWFQTREGRAFLQEQIQNDFRRLTQDPVLFFYPDIATEEIYSRIRKSMKSKKKDSGSKSRNEH